MRLARGLASLFLALALAACQKAAPALTPTLPAGRTPAAAPAPPETAPPAATAPEPPTVPSAKAGEAAPPEEGASEEEPGSEAESAQKEALEACQAAEELLGRGEIDAALAAVDRAYARMLDLPGNGDDTYLQAKQDIRLLAADLIRRIHQAGRRAAAPAAASRGFAMPALDNAHVQREIQSFTTVERELFVEGYRRSGLYRPMILARLEKAGLPAQLSWLPLVESWFKAKALSRASALGLWQFISSTGVRYGLSRDTWVDERLDAAKSTDAAIAYLTDLHDLFGDWPKALAAYNCGEARVMRLSRPSGDEYLDFWDLYELLPHETRRYVPRLLAALQVIENPAKYGMTLPPVDAPPSGIATVRVQRSVRLDRLDAALGLEAGTLAALNPELRRQATPKRAYDLRVPVGREEALFAKVGTLPEWTPPAPQYATHRVRSGETLSLIASRYGTTVAALMRANGLRSANRLQVGQHLRVPLRGGAAASAAGAGDAEASR
ncbi:MAG TPA: transglycosylase SLT domain-containing protein [Vicinamibacteria bacterium]|nr:transglycosylase SLT domain-containing protein [Vicinamibacteria bacterium]